MKIICIGRNYGAHARELGNALPEEPVFFLKPETALLASGAAFTIPDWSGSIHYELELVLRVSRECRNEQVIDVNDFIDAITLGIDFTARDIQDELKQKGLPWEKAKAFDGSAAIGNGFLPVPTDLTSQTFLLELNGKIVQQGNVSEMIFSPAQLLTHVSRYITLMPGDLLFTGTPAGVGPVNKGDRLTGKLDGAKLLDLRIAG
jgi:acylpyruvate hydrolase